MDASIRLLRTSYDHLLNRKEHFLERFFHELLGTMPHLRKLYTRTDPELLHRYFLRALEIFVSLDEERDNLAGFARSLGARHVRYGVSALDMSAAVPLLLHAMRDVLGPFQGWTAESQAAWADLLWTAISAMREGALAAERDVCLWDDEMETTSVLPVPHTPQRKKRRKTGRHGKANEASNGSAPPHRQVHAD